MTMLAPAASTSEPALTAPAADAEEVVTRLRDLQRASVPDLDAFLAVRAAMKHDPLWKHVQTVPAAGGADGFEMYVSMSVYDAATLRGIENFDTALPQGWVVEVRQQTGRDVVGHFVYSYAAPHTFGAPVPITREGDEIHQILLAAGHLHA